MKKDKTQNRFCIYFFSLLSEDHNTLINLINEKIVPFIQFFCPMKYQYLYKLVQNLCIEKISNFTYEPIRIKFPVIDDKTNMILLCAHIIACIVNPNNSTILDESSMIQPPSNSSWLPSFEKSAFLNLIFYLVMERELFCESGTIGFLSDIFQQLSKTDESDEEFNDETSFK